MRSLSLPRPLARALALLALLGATSLAAQSPDDTPATAQTSAPTTTAPADQAAEEDGGIIGSGTEDAGPKKNNDTEPKEPTGFPSPFELALAAMILFGALGAFAADLVTDGGLVEPPHRGEQGIMLGALGKLVIGSVAAVVMLTLNPSGPDWPTLIGTALVAGLGGEFILLSIINARKAQDAENARQNAQEETQRVEAQAAAKLESVGRMAIEAGRTRRVQIEGLRVSGADAETADAFSVASADDSDFERLVNSAVEQAKSELAAR
jgi:Protein of unknown function (DUF4257)